MKTLKEKGLTHALKKAPGSKKKRKHADKEANGAAIENGTTTKPSSSDEDKKASAQEKKDKKEKDTAAASIGIKNSATASLTRKVMEEQEARNKKRKLAQNDTVNSLFNKSEGKPSVGNSADYMTRGFSIGKNEGA
jgi:hypothetical protein